jgi:TRAP-type mannitol/chloroaromatic compound transport system permease small subunit
MPLFDALTSSKNGMCSDTISRLYLFRAVLLLAQYYTMHLTKVYTTQYCQSRNQTLKVATNMSLFDALMSSKNGVCTYTISSLCLFQAVLMLAQHYTIRLTTVVTAQWCHSRRQSPFTATNMSLFDALKSSKNGVCSDTF